MTDTQSSITQTWILFSGPPKHHTSNVQTLNSVFPQRAWSAESVCQKREKLYGLFTVASYKGIVICDAFCWRIDLSVGSLVMWDMFVNRQHGCKTMNRLPIVVWVFHFALVIASRPSCVAIMHNAWYLCGCSVCACGTLVDSQCLVEPTLLRNDRFANSDSKL